jgi:hypothetical protein
MLRYDNYSHVYILISSCHLSTAIWASPACARAVLMAVVFSGGTVFTPSSTADELPVAMPLHARDREVSACTLRALATCRTQQQSRTHEW